MSGETVYKYRVPLEVEDGVNKPAYDSALNAHPIYREYQENHLVVVFADSIAHFHRDDVNVSIEEVKGAEYGYENTEDEQTEDTEEGGDE